MTTEEKRDEMIRRGRIILDPWDALSHYAVILMLGLISILTITLAWNQSPPNPTNATLTNDDIIIWTVVEIILMIAFYLIQKERLKLKKEIIDLDELQILETINSVGQKFDWILTTVSKDFIQADSITILGFYNRITILIRDKDVFINCRTTRGQIGGFFRQGKITDSFLTALRMKSHEIKYQNEKLEKQASR